MKVSLKLRLAQGSEIFLMRLDNHLTDYLAEAQEITAATESAERFTNPPRYRIGVKPDTVPDW